MISLLLVDDEDLEIHGLIAMIKAFDLPIEICATARNGMDGLLKARTHKPNVVITDLCMPKLNGVDMLKQIYEELPYTKLVLISGFEDFHAAREVLPLGTLAYLLKPVNRDELYRLLCKCCQIGEQQEKKMPTSTNNPFSIDDEQFIRRLLFATEGRISAILTDYPVYKDFFAKTIFSVATIEILSDNGRDIFDCAETLQAFAKKNNSLAPVFIDNAKATIVLNAPIFVEENAFIDTIMKISKELQFELCNIDVHEMLIGVSDTATNPEKLPILYKQSLHVLEQRIQKNISQVLFYENNDWVKDGSENNVIKLIQKIIHTEYATPLSIDIIAERLYLSPSHIRRLFKNKTGVTIMDYLENVRLNHSRTLLAQHRYKIHEIGVMVGYESPSYFNMVFKKYYGVTPGDYRKSLDI